MRKIAILTLLAAGVVGLAWAAGKPAMVRLKQEGIVADIVLEKGPRLTLSTKPVPLAEGQYPVKAVKLTKLDDKKHAWEMQGDGSLSTLDVVTVEAGQDKVIDLGEPILYDCFIWANGKTAGATKEVLIRVTALGKYSEVYYPGACLGGKRPPPPAWKLVSVADDKVLAQGQFAMAKGANGVVSATVSIPKDFKAKARLDLAPVMGPFEWKYRSQESDFGKR